MFRRLSLFAGFIASFTRYALYIREVIVSLLLLICFGGFLFSRLEDVKLGDSIYFAFITALSIGYGDIHPQTTGGRIVSVAIGLVGMLFVGITVGVATRALVDTAKQHLEPDA